MERLDILLLAVGVLFAAGMLYLSWAAGDFRRLRSRLGRLVGITLQFRVKAPGYGTQKR